MNARVEVMDPRDKAEADALFAKPLDNSQLVPSGSGGAPSIVITDQIITAQKVTVERDLQKVIRNIRTLAAVAGEDWYYRFPVKKKGGGVDQIEGPTIKCAQNVAREYGNCQVDCRAMDQGTSWMIYARFVDYETGFSLTRPFQADKAKVNINTKDPGRQQEIAFAIGVSKATRNVITNALETFTNLAFEEAKNNLIEKVGKKLDEYRKRVRERLTTLEVDERRVELQLGRKADEWLAPDVTRVIAELKAIGDGMATIDETWPPLAPDAPNRADFGKGAATPAAGAATTTTTTPPSGGEGGAAAGPPTDDAGAKSPANEQQQKRSWKLADSIVGQEPKRKAILEMLDMTESDTEVDDLKAEHREFLDKLGRNKAETMQAFEARKAALAEAAKG